MGNIYDIYNVDFNQHYYSFTKEELVNIKETYNKNNVEPLFKEMMKEVMDVPLQSVTYERSPIASEFDVHDYFSQALYFWPDPDKENGLPYIQHDGVVNPETLKYAKLALRKTAFAIYNLSMAYYLTKDKEYYERLKKHIYNFFINEDTKVNPNINHAQMIPGHPVHGKGRGIGIIDFGACIGYGFVILKDLYDMNLLEEEVYSPLRQWCCSLIEWLETNKLANDERNQGNNHGTMYTLFLTQLYYYVGEVEANKEKLLNELNNRKELQISEDGRMDKELERTRAVSYSTMNLKAFIDTYKLLGIDWTKQPEIIKAFKFLSPILNNERQINEITVLDRKQNIIRPCEQMEGKYLECFKVYLHYLGKQAGIKVNIVNSEEVPYKYYLLMENI